MRTALVSYDLFFRPPPGRPLPSDDELTSWFLGRRHYSVDKRQACYRNEDTGVYFIFDFPDTGDEVASGEEDPALEQLAPCLAFNLNYFRPSYFGLEAAPELDAVVEHFGFEVEDPQRSGMGDGPYSTEGFLRGWNAGSQLAYGVMLDSEHAPDQVFVCPTERLHACWRWNYDRDALSAQLGDSIFVPRIVFALLDDTVHTAVIWTDAMAIALPEVDVIIMCRGDTDTCVCPYEDARPLLEDFATEGKAPYRRLDYREPPPELVALFAAQTPMGARRFFISADKVLDEELVLAAVEDDDE